MNENTTSLRYAAAYVRVSTDGQMDLSPESQLDKIREYATQHNILLSPEYIFMEKEGHSGKRADNRPAFQQMIATAKQKPKPFDAILLWKFSRFARNQDESTFYKSMLRKKLGIDVISVSEPVMEGMYGRLIEMIIEWQDEFYSYNLAAEVTRGMTKKALKGGYQARPPLGYRIPYHGANPEIVPDEAETVRKIFHWYAEEQAGMLEIARRLNEMGILTSHGKPFERRSIEYILQNPAYCGITRWNRTTNATNTIKPESEWILAPGTHPAIISEELFHAAEKRFQMEYRPKHAQPAERAKHWLSGAVKCSACGRTLSSCSSLTRQKTPYCYFQCYGYLKGKCSSNHYISAKKLEAAVLHIFSTADATNITYDIKYVSREARSSDNRLLQKQLEKLAQKEKRAREAYLNGLDSIEEYKTTKELLSQERERIEASLKKYESMQKSPETDRLMLERIRKVYTILISDDHDTVSKNTSLKSVVDKIVFDRETMALEVYYYLAI
ncbi:MAG: recombinase family protein [bacterium]|nr:recombinase family protein [bacterium]